MLLDYIHLSHLKVQMVSITDQYNYMIYSVSHSVLQSCGTEVGEPLSGSHPRFNFHLTKNTDSHCASFPPLHLAQSTSDLCSARWSWREPALTALLQRWGIQMNLGYTMTPASQCCLPSFVGLSRMWLNQLCMMYWVRLIVHLSVQCSERSPIFNALCGATWRVKEMQIHVDRCYKKGRWGLGSA